MKNKKLLSILMSIIMMTNGFVGCVKTKQAEPENNTTTSDGLLEGKNEEKEVTVTIGNRDYLISESKISYTIKNGDNLWSIGRDLHISEEKIMEYNKMSSDLIYPGDEVTIPISAFKDINKKTGIKVSEENGDINWGVVRYFTDFALLTAADFSQDRYVITETEKELLKEYFDEDTESYRRLVDTECIDSKIEKNMKDCEENDIDYGIVVYGDINNVELNEEIQTGKEDAQEVVSYLDGYDVTYPVILEISKYDSNNLNSCMGEIGYFSDENEYNREKNLSEQYCIDFLTEIKANGYYPMLSVPDEIYACSVSENKDLKKFDTIIYNPWESDDRYDEFNKINCNISKGEEVDMPGIKRMQSYCETYVDNTNVGIENIVSKKIKKDVKESNKSNTSLYKNVGILLGVLVGGSIVVYLGRKNRIITVDKEKGIALSIKRKNKKK